MSARFENLILDYKRRLKSALASENRDLANACTSMISGFRILMRMEKGPEKCAFPPSCFNGRYDG